MTDLDSQGDARITMTAGPELFGTSVVIETRQIDGVAYADYSDILGAIQDRLPKALRGRDWVRIDASELAAAPTDSSSNPSSQLDVIRGLAKSSVETRGTETVNGAETKIKVGANGTFKISNTDGPTLPHPSSGTVHVIVDIVGWFR